MGTRRARSWDRHSIMAEVRSRGSNLRRLSLRAGLCPSACCKAFPQPFPAAEAAISEFLGVTVQDLFPDRYPTLPASRRENATNGTGEPSLNATTIQTPTIPTRASAVP